VARLEASQAALLARLESALGEAEDHRDALAERLAALNEELEGVVAGRDDEREREDAMAARLAALEAEIGELRRTQLALSAQLEALRP
jgi:chromosome segregation ATPase